MLNVLTTILKRKKSTISAEKKKKVMFQKLEPLLVFRANASFGKIGHWVGLNPL